MAQRYSQNGWPVLVREETAVVRVAGTPFRVAPGTEPLWEAFVTRFVAEVEPLTGPVLDDWSWADRNVRGSTTVISNHASATALDLNAEKHPRGVRDSFTSGQVAALRKLLRAFPVIRWGGDFHTTVDDMHFEINASHAEVAAFIKTLQPAEDDVTRDELRAEVCAILGLDPKDPRIQTGWQDDGSFDPSRPLKVSVAKALAADRGGSLHASAGVDNLTGRLVGLEQGLNTLTELVQAIQVSLAPPASPAG